MSIDIIGTIYEQTGEVTTDADGLEYPVMQAIHGYHVNTIDETIEGADEYIVPQPSSPSRLYSGRTAREHTFYRFPDEATFRQFVPEPQEVENETA